MNSTMGLGICALMLLFNISASFAAHDKKAGCNVLRSFLVVVWKKKIGQFP